MAVILRGVISSNIKAVGYDAGLGDLYVRFSSGTVYRYRSVPSQTYLDLINAPSIGSFFSSNIKTSYPFVKLSQAGAVEDTLKEEPKEEPKEEVKDELKSSEPVGTLPFDAGSEIVSTKYAVRVVGSHSATNEIIITAKPAVSVEIAALLKVLGITYKLDITK